MVRGIGFSINKELMFEDSSVFYYRKTKLKELKWIDNNIIDILALHEQYE